MPSSSYPLSTKFARTALQALALLACAPLAHAGTTDNAMTRTSFRGFAADVNGDGLIDVLLRPTPRIINLPMGNEVELQLPIPPAMSDFVLLSGSDGGYTLRMNPEPALLNNPLWVADMIELVFGDVLGDGAGAVLIKARSPNAPSFVVVLSAATGALKLNQQLTPAAIGIDLGATSIQLELKDQNADGRADLIVQIDGRTAAVVLADREGRFYRNDAATIQALWRRLLDALGSGNGALALQQISEESRDKYSNAFASLRPREQPLPGKFSDLQFIELTPEYARAVVARIGSEAMHFISFINRYGEWQVLEF